jgi:hypothetical protein
MHRLLRLPLLAASLAASPLAAQSSPSVPSGGTYLAVSGGLPVVLAPKDLADRLDGRAWAEVEVWHALSTGLEIGLAYRYLRLESNATTRGSSSVRAIIPTLGVTTGGRLPVRPFLQVGAGLLTVSDRTPSFGARTERSLGFDATAGVVIPFEEGAAARIGGGFLLSTGSFESPNPVSFGGLKAGLQLRL